jgi:hypothetical protein
MEEDICSILKWQESCTQNQEQLKKSVEEQQKTQ